MTLVKFRNPLIPILNEPSILGDPFFSDLLETQKNLFNLNRIFNGGSAVTPAMNVKETEKDYEIEMAAPGLTKNDFNITVDDGVLTISAEKEMKSEEEDENYLRREFSYNSFSRSMSIPETIDESKDIKAEYHDGVLKVMLHKNPEAKTKAAKKIKVS